MFGSKVNIIEEAFIKSDNEEISQAITRLVFIFIITLVFLINYIFFNTDNISLIGIGLAVSVAIYAIIHFSWVKKHPSKNSIRRLVAIFVDISSVSLALVYLEFMGLFIYPLYLWIIVGNGMRFGSNYLFAAMLIAFIEFTNILLYVSFWIENNEVGIGLLGVIIILPLFFIIMIRRLQVANMKLKKQLEIQKKQEAILIQQSRHAAMGEMISNIAHQWRQPLNAMGLLVQNIENMYEMEMLDDAYMKRSVEKANRLTQTMSRTIDDFRDFFKPNKNKESFYISEEIEHSLGIIGESLNSHSIELVMNLDKSTVFYGYPNEFSQVIINLLANAKDMLIEKEIKNPTIWVDSYEDENSIVITIKDNGSGIAVDIMDKVFEPYFTTKDEGKGTGIGLYMSKLIIEDHLNGELSVKNGEEGAEFTIKLMRKSKTGSQHETQK